MRTWEREAHFIREVAYQNFLEYRRIWDCIESLDSEDDLDSPEAQRAWYRAFQQRALADFLDKAGSYNFYTRYRNDQQRNNQHEHNPNQATQTDLQPYPY